MYVQKTKTFPSDDVVQTKIHHIYVTNKGLLKKITHNLFMQQQYNATAHMCKSSLCSICIYTHNIWNKAEKKNKKIYRKDIKQINLAYYCDYEYCVSPLMPSLPRDIWQSTWVLFTQSYIMRREQYVFVCVCVKRWNNVKKQRH